MLIYKSFLTGLALYLFSSLGFASETSWDVKRAIAVPKAHITDEVGWLSASQEQQLNSLLAKLFQDTEIQMAVYLIASLEGEVLEQYSLAVAESWKLGKASSDKGILLLVAKKERRLRLEVGQGLEGDIPDARAKQIIEDRILPYFKKGRFADGIVSGIQSVIQFGAPDYKLAGVTDSKRHRSALKKKEPSFLAKIFNLIFTIIMIIVFIRNPFLFLLFLGGGRGGSRGGGSFGGFSGGGGGFSGGGSSGGW